MDLEIRHVQLFLALAEELHFSRAAARLGLPQSALSQQLNRIERKLGVRLFERTTRTVTLTDAGRELLPAARAADAAMRRLTQCADARARPARTLRIAMGSPRTGELIDAIQERHPGLSVQHSVLLEDAAVPAFARGNLDVIMAAEQPSRPFRFNSRLRTATIVEEPVWVALPQCHPLAEAPPVRLADLSREIWIEYPEGTFEHEFLLTICGETGFVPNIGYMATDREVICDLLRRGRGIVVTTPAVPGYDNCVTLPLHPVIMRRLVVAWNPARCPEAVAQTILAHMRWFYRDQARKNPAYWAEISADPHRYRYLYPLNERANEREFSGSR
jgi:DNA-binding transcriptional LysR family regulator